MSTSIHCDPSSLASKPLPGRFSVLDKYFQREEQQAMLEADLAAGSGVGWMLVGVIALGSSLGIGAVVLLLMLG